MNITSYKSAPEEKKVYFGKVSIKKGYYAASGDEYFYDFIGVNSCYSFTELIHSEDVGEFLKAAGELDKEPQCIIARVRCYNDKYRWLYMVMKLNGRVVDGFKSFDIEFNDIMTINENYVKYADNIKKYRTFMSFSSQMFFEYDMSNDNFQIYTYKNTKSCPVFNSKLENVRASAYSSKNISGTSLAGFETFYDYLKKSAGIFNIKVAASIFGDQQNDKVYEIKGGTIYKDNSKNLVVGIIEDNQEHQGEEEEYYLSDAACDSGTGLLNKRAISEYAISKIARCEDSFYLAIMDVDNFKGVNDGYGHMFGDEVLAKVAEMIKSVIVGRGVAGRFGGDEFMIVFDEVNSEEDLRRIIKTICKHVQWAYAGIVDNFKLTTSMGIAKFPVDGTSYEELFNKADKSLYIAKAKGKNRYIIYDEKKHGSIKDEDSTDRRIGIKAIVDEDHKGRVVSDIILDLHMRGKEAINQAMVRMKEYFDIDGITVYADADMKRIYSVGRYIGAIESLSFINNKDYRKFFNDNSTYIESTVRRLDGKLSSIYHQYQKQETGKFIQCAYFKEDKAMAVVSFDFFNRSPKFGDNDTNLITIVGRMIAMIAGE